MIKPRGILIAGNWKMNLGPRGTKQFISGLKEQMLLVLTSEDRKLLEQGRLKACLIPPFLSLETAHLHLSQFPFPIAVAAQNAHWEEKGAYTGEISGPMLQEAGIRWVLIGHSERRRYFGESDIDVQKRAESLLAQGFQVILCIGETQEEREGGKTVEILTRQLTVGMPQIKPGSSSFLNGQLILAYEPVWAIGTGLTASSDQAEEAHQQIRNHLQSRFGLESAIKTPILYGGSVTPENIDSLLACSQVDGALVGGASLKANDFLALVSAGAKILGTGIP